MDHKDGQQRASEARGTAEEPSLRKARIAVVGLGASAGGLQALERFFKAVPADLGVAFVVVVHLSPEHQSELPAILSRYTAMPVTAVTAVLALRPNHVYVIPPDRKLEISNDSVAATPFEEPRGKRTAIDSFFRSLAREHGDGFAVILSGGGSDGALGIRACKEAGGIVLVQDPTEAAHDGMPRAAIATGLADVVLPAAELAVRLAELARSKQDVVRVLAQEPELGERDEHALSGILTLIRARTTHDFSRYKRSTILRRTLRRMHLQHKTSIEQYFDYLRGNVGELQSLFDDLLISVTSFFRDPEAWIALEREVIGALFENRAKGRPVRAWTAGCATGEEAYSLAILLIERMESMNQDFEVTIFASDLDESSLARAREGLYPESIVADVSDDRLRRFFRREGDAFRISRQVRDCVTFASHNLLRDPPFSGLDIVTCRNVLIYLDRPIQEQVTAIFRYACLPQGYLFLGQAEIADAGMFATIDKKHRIYQTRAPSSSRQVLPELLLATPRNDPWESRRTLDARGPAPVHRELLEQVGPPSVLVDEHRNLVHLSETAGRFLRARGGAPVRDVTELVRPELQLEVRTRLNRAFDKNESGFSPPITVSFDGSMRRVSVFVTPQPPRKGEERLALVVFLDGGVIAPSEVEESASGDPNASDDLIAAREEIRELHQRMETTLENYQLASEELRAANEELLSINEEYRSTSEELETSKEELQSINEELQTVNVELKLKFEEVSRANDDLENLMSGTEIGTLFLDRALAIYRFTPRMGDIFNFQFSDRGRSLSDFTHRLDYHDLVRDAEHVLATLLPVERRAKSSRGETFMVRIRPYRTLQSRVDGIVITFFDVTELTAIENKLRESERELTEELGVSRRLYEMTIQAVAAHSSRDALDEILKASIELQRADFGMLQLLHADSGQLQLVAQRGFDSEMLGEFEEMRPNETTSYGRVVHTKARTVIEDVALQSGADKSIALAVAGGYRAVHSVPLISDDNAVLGVLSTHFRAPRKITERDKRVLDTLARQAANLIARWRSEEALVKLNDQLTRQSVALREQDTRRAEFMAVLGHELRNPLAAIRSAATLFELRRDSWDGHDPEVQQAQAILLRQSQHMTHIVNDLLDITRITHGKLRLNLQEVDLRQVVRHSVDAMRMRVGTGGPRIQMQLPAEAVFVRADPDRLLQIVDNLLTNALHHGREHGPIDIAMERIQGAAEVRVRDYGRGMTPEVISKLFEPFFQGGEPERSPQGLGLGLAVVRRLVELHGGTIDAESPAPGRGSEFRVRLPAVDATPAARVATPRPSRQLRVLVVDDQRDVADGLGFLLKSLGHHVHVAYDGASAVTLAGSARPEVAILDLSMPDMTGRELAARLRAAFSDLRLIAMSGLGTDTLPRGSNGVDFEKYLTKPPDIETLLLALETPS